MATEEPVAIACREMVLAGRLHRPAETPRAGVVLAHGLGSSMQSEKFSRLAPRLAGRGFLTLRYDAMGCGQSPGDPRRTTLGGRRDELLAAIRFLARETPGLPLCYVGSSLGAAAAILAAGEVPPACLVALAAPVDLDDLSRRLEPDAASPEYPDLAAEATRHDPRAALGRLSRILLIHGEADRVVPVAHARLGFSLARAPKELLIVPGADHSFTDPAARARVLAACLDFIVRHAA